MGCETSSPEDRVPAIAPVDASPSTIGLKLGKVKIPALSCKGSQTKNKNNGSEEVKKGAEAARRVVAEVERGSMIPLPSLINALMEKRQKSLGKKCEG